MIGDLTGRIAIVTGASSGIGKAVAKTLQAHGAHVIYADLRVDDELIPPDAAGPGPAGASLSVKCDVTQEKEVESLIENAVTWKGRLDILCCMAGISTENIRAVEERLHECPTDDLDKTLAVNVKGVWLCCKYALAQMLRQGPLPPNARNEQTRGWIVNAASMLGLIAFARAPCYVASKHAIVGLTKQIALDYAEDRIHCNAICPGFVDTPMNKPRTATEEKKMALGKMHPWGTLGTAEDIANSVLFLVSPESCVSPLGIASNLLTANKTLRAWTTGSAMVIDGGYTTG